MLSLANTVYREWLSGTPYRAEDKLLWLIGNALQRKDCGRNKCHGLASSSPALKPSWPCYTPAAPAHPWYMKRGLLQALWLKAQHKISDGHTTYSFSILAMKTDNFKVLSGSSPPKNKKQNFALGHRLETLQVLSLPLSHLWAPKNLGDGIFKNSIYWRLTVVRSEVRDSG